MKLLPTSLLNDPWISHYKITILNRAKEMGLSNTLRSLRERKKKEMFAAGAANDVKTSRIALRAAAIELGIVTEEEVPETGPGMKLKATNVDDMKSLTPELVENRVDGLKALKSKASVSAVKAVEWVGEHLGRVDVKMEDAPSALAWTMLEWARGNQDLFFTTFIKGLMPTKAQVDQGSALKDDGHDKIGSLLDAALERIKDDSPAES